ncbi:TetR/AcrR family transcriptional regulator [Nocardia sp. NPDC050406]|uniref:TetR/AcrR family transcriptional regulator n=1 Tax=Nocardia sp. NPDC050406 TaxID=3364318 RepID=UPI00379EC497
MTVEPLRDRLVSAGVELLEETGASELGLRAIAREAGVSHGAPRRYFPTHTALLAAIAARGFVDLGSTFATHQNAEPRARVAGIALDYVGFAAERREMFTLMFRHDLLEGSGENLRQRTLPLYHQWATFVTACAVDHPEDRALALWTNLHGIAVLVANRSLELVAPGRNWRHLVTEAVDQHLGTSPTAD